MMKNRLFLIFTFLVSLFSLTNHSFYAMENKPNQFPFHEAEKGQTRWVIDLPVRSNESDLRVEIIPGKEMLVDCNQRFLGGELKKEILKGWGYNYFVYKNNQNEGISTLMACIDDSKQNQFIKGQSLTVDYNSKLPLVIYTPEGFSVEYQIWQASKSKKAIQK